MSKATITCVIVKLLVVSCLTGASTHGITTNSPRGPAVQKDTSSSEIIGIISKEVQRSSWAIENLTSDRKEIGRSISKGMCSSGESSYSETLKSSLKSLLQQLITAMKEDLAIVNIPELPSYRNKFDENNDISELKLKNLKFKGLENVVISQFIYDFCGLTSSFELYVPKLEITSTYNLNGTINGLPISGDGTLNVTMNMVGAYQQSFVECNVILLKDDVCEFTLKNRTIDMSAEKVVVSLDNIKYGKQSVSEINFGINDFVSNYLQTDRVNLIQKITELVETYKQQLVSHRSPASFLKHLEGHLKGLSTKLDRKQRSMPTDNANTTTTSNPWDTFVGIFVNIVVQ